MKVHCKKCDNTIEMKDYDPSEHQYGGCSAPKLSRSDKIALIVSFLSFMVAVFIPITLLFYFGWDNVFLAFVVGVPFVILSICCELKYLIN